MIRLGNEVVDYNPDFRLYLLTKLHNPHYPPEISTKVTVINFMVTQKGLEDQMLSKIMALEEAKLEENRIKKVEEMADLTEKKQFLDENILRHLNYTKGHLLDDVALIQDLGKCCVCGCVSPFFFCSLIILSSHMFLLHSQIKEYQRQLREAYEAGAGQSGRDHAAPRALLSVGAAHLRPVLLHL
jgi:hypothetical protein